MEAEIERIITEELPNITETSENTEPEKEDLLATDSLRRRFVDSKEDPLKEEKEKRETLIRLAEDGEIDKSVAHIKKASKKVIDKLYEEYERKRMRRANEFITEHLITKFAETLGGLDAIELPGELSEELRKDELLRRDVYSVVEKLSPYIPFIGILSGGITTAKHIYNHSDTPKSQGDPPSRRETLSK